MSYQNPTPPGEKCGLAHDPDFLFFLHPVDGIFEIDLVRIGGTLFLQPRLQFLLLQGVMITCTSSNPFAQLAD